MEKLQLSNRAKEEHQKGNIVQAIKLYSELLSIYPDSEEILFLNGIAHRQNKNYSESVKFLSKAAELNKNNGKILYELAVTYQKIGKPIDEIIEMLEIALKNDFRGAEIYFFLGDLYRQIKQFDNAISNISKAIACKRDHFFAQFTLGMLFSEVNKYKEALTHLKIASELKPDSVEVNNNIGLILLRMGCFKEAVNSFNKAYAIKPDDLIICKNYVDALTYCEYYDRAIEILVKQLLCYPDSPELLNGLGNLYQLKNDGIKAKEYYIKAIKSKFDFAEAHYNLGLIMKNWDMLDDAVICFKNAISFKPDFCDAYFNLGNTYQILGEIERSEELFKHVLRIDPDRKDAYDNLLLSINYNEKYSAYDVYCEHKKWGDKLHVLQHNYKNEKCIQKRLKIGYVSSDFCNHPASKFFESVITSHGDNFEIYCYAHIVHRDEKTDLFKTNAAHWIEIQEMSDTELCQRIVLDGIDILVDCTGHLNGNRLNVFAMRPAPVQISAFGYPCTTGLQTINYRLADEITETPQSAKNSTESIIYMESGFCCFKPEKNDPEITSLPFKENGYITFGSLHTTSRLNEQVIALWSAILKQIPNSKMLLFRTTLCESVKARLNDLFFKNGVDISRIEYQSRVPKNGYLLIYNYIDVQLDTFPWSGHTTACESLWMGVPVITLYGDRHAGRMVSSVLTHCGMKEWITYSKDEYINKAISVSENVESLQKTRAELRNKMSQSVLCDKRKYTEVLEREYQRIWEIYCRS